jgi:hypothetical protein
VAPLKKSITPDEAINEAAVPIVRKFFPALISLETNKDPLVDTEPVTSTLPDTSNTNEDFGTFPIPTLLPLTTNALLLYAPAITLSSLKTSRIGRPEGSLTLIKLPTTLSEMSNKEPDLPTNATVPSCSTSRFMLDEAAPIKCIFGLFDPVGANIISPVLRLPLISKVARGDVVDTPTRPLVSYIMLFPREFAAPNFGI